MVLIESLHNQQLKLYRSLAKRKYRQKYGLLPLEGTRLVGEALLQKVAQPKFILLRGEATLEDFALPCAPPVTTTVLNVAEKVFAQTAFTESPQGILAVVEQPQMPLSAVFTQQPALILVVDGVQDPGNLGTMIRSAAAVGASGVVLLPGTVDATNPKTLRASMGAYFALPVVETSFTTLHSSLQKHQVQLVITGSQAARSYEDYDWQQSVAVVIGNEGAGVSPPVREAAATAVAIPMAQAVESLNAAIAMSVLFFEAARQRRQ
ncbi:MAG TPA: RNA methyltransferase [Oscillospiraceae bacterium]|nr:RNA methyltransferase [Oscillospiraceae bacterium]